MKWPAKINHELRLAREARAHGNEGRARVCARRAASIAGRIYLDAHGGHLASDSGLDVLSRLAEDPRLAGGAKRIARLLTLQVDTDFNLPPGVDLIAEAETLCRLLLN